LRVAADYLRMVRGFNPDARRFLAFTGLNAIAWNSYNLVFNLYVHSLGYQQDFIGILNGLPFLVILILGLPIGMAADRYGYRQFLLVGAVMAAISGVGLGLSSSPSALVLFCVFRGLAGSMSWVIGPPMLMAISTDEERVYLFSVQSALMMGAGFIGSLLAGAAPEVIGAHLGVDSASTLPLRITYLAGASVNVLAILPIWGLSRQKSSDRPAAARRPLPTSPEEFKLFGKLLLPTMLISFGAGAMVVFFQLFFKLRFGLNPGSIGVLFAFSAVVTAGATLIAPLLAKRLGKVRTVVVTELVSIPFLLILAWSLSFPTVVVAYYARSALMNMAGPIQQMFALEQVKKDQRATLTSLNAMLGSLGRGGLGPIISGYIQVRSGFSAAFTMTTVCYIIGSSLFFLFFRNAERAPGRRDRAAVSAGARG